MDNYKAFAKEIFDWFYCDDHVELDMCEVEELLLKHGLIKTAPATDEIKAEYETDEMYIFVEDK